MKKALIVLMHVLFIAVLAMTAWSLFRMATYQKTTCSPAGDGVWAAVGLLEDDGTVRDVVKADEISWAYNVNGRNYARNVSMSDYVEIGDQLTLWYDPAQPEKNFMLRDYLPFYAAAGIFAVAEIAYLAGRRTRKTKPEAELALS